jgi:prolyl oligopeptidase
MLRHDCLGIPEQDGQAAAAAPNPAWRCPKVLFTTSTRDDRVHPGHARKMVQSLLMEAGNKMCPLCLYYENIEGGHGASATNSQRAHMWAMTYEFLKKELRL